MTAHKNRPYNFWYAIIVILPVMAFACTPKCAWGDDMEQQFVSPPNSAKPRVWWHWMDGNITEEGIEADLHWMKRVGIGGLHQMDAGLNTPQLVENRLGYMSPQWKEALRFSVDLAAKLDLEFGIFSSPGWSITGGPWVKPNQAMKKLVWSETVVKGGALFSGKLPALPIATGPFQHISVQKGGGLVAWEPTRSLPEYNKDTAVIAYRNPTQSPEPPPPRVTSNTNLVEARALTDGNSATELMLPATISGKPPWIQMEYETPLEVRSATVSVSPPGSVVNLAVSEDGKKYRLLHTFYLGITSTATIAIEPVKARFFRYSLHSPKPPAEVFSSTAAPGVSPELSGKLFSPGAAPPPLLVHDLVLRQAVRVNQFEHKAGFDIASDYYAIATQDVPQSLAVPKGDVIDITGLMQPDGTLRWQAPAGDWVVLRMGYSLTGNMNHAASVEGTGLEVDKLNQQYVAEYLDTYLEKYTNAVGPSLIGKRGLNAFMTDSLEVGVQNWTDDMLQQFARLRGYDPRPWLPTLTGIVVESAKQSDKFLWDFRKTISDLMLESHYKLIADKVHARGLTLYGEALESWRTSLGDDMDFRRYTDVPTAAMWTFSPTAGPGPGYIADILGAASVAHIYGQNLVGAESLTSALAPWAFAPRDIKSIVDLEFALGVNRPIIHSSVHQPLNNMLPGFSLSIFGQYFNRHETWAEQSKGWIDYLSRCSYLLQQGQYVADIAYFYGEEAPLVALFGTTLSQELPQGHGFDFINADGILNHLSVEDGSLATPSGMRYRLLYLGGSSQKMTVPVLRKLRALVAAGAVVVGAKPLASPSLADDPAEFSKVAEEIWGPTDLEATEPRRVQLGQVFQGTDLDAALAKLHIPKDFEYKNADSDTKLMFQHRRISDGDIYFVSNRSDREESVEATFRVSGKQPELWHPDTGETKKTSYRIENNRTIVPLVLSPAESTFVIFREFTSESVHEINARELSVIATLDGSWRLSFPPQGSSPGLTRLQELGSWSAEQDESIRYFSGTATYTQDLVAHENWFGSGNRLILNLGDVRELAQLSVNGQSLGVLWKPPYIADVTDSLHPGPNTVEVKVTNLWVNRLIGDQQPGVTAFTATSAPTYQADAPLRPSGLIGPVRIEKLTSR